VIPAFDAFSRDKGGYLGRFTDPLLRVDTFDLPINDCTQNPDDLYNLFHAGRPLWSSFLDGMQHLDKEVRLNELVSVALIKLTSREDIPDADILKVTDETRTKCEEVKGITRIMPGLVAAFACRFSFGWASQIAPKLAKHCLATIIRVSEERTLVYTCYPSEPVLAEASARFTSNFESLKNVLNTVHAAIISGLLDPPRGDLGEMCAAALLGFTMDSIRDEENHDFFSKSFKLKSLLSFFGCESNMQVDDVLEGWEVNFTHFEQSPYNLDSKRLASMWKRRMAYYVPEGMKGLDLLIAINHEDKGYGTLKVQVKNYAAKTTESDCNIFLEKLALLRCPPFDGNEKLCVGLLLCVNSVEKTEPCALLHYSDTRKKIWPQPKKSPDDRMYLQLVSAFPHNNDIASTRLKYISEKLSAICEKMRTCEVWDPTHYESTD
jgi:hypothetical protein